MKTLTAVTAVVAAPHHVLRPAAVRPTRPRATRLAHAEIAEHESHGDPCGRGGTIRGARRLGRRGVTRIRRSPRVLPRRADAHALARLGHQVGSLAAAVRLERQVPGGRQRRLGRIDPVRRARRGAPARLRRRVHQCRTYRRGRELRARPSGEADRFRLPCGARNRRAEQGGDCRLLRQGAAAVLLQRLLGRRAHGVPGSAALSGRLRRHPRRRARLRPREPERADADERESDARPSGQHDSAGQVRGDSPRGARRLRRRRRPEGRPDQRSAELPLRSQGARVQRRRRGGLPDLRRRSPRRRRSTPASSTRRPARRFFRGWSRAASCSGAVRPAARRRSPSAAICSSTSSSRIRTGISGRSIWRGTTTPCTRSTVWT